MDIKALVAIPQAKQGNARKVWSIDLETVWLPFFTATNAVGETAIPADALGAPLRLAYEKDGTTPRFSDSGRPVIRVAKELAQHVTYVRQNFTASLIAHAHEVATENPDAYKAMVEANMQAGAPIIRRDSDKLTAAIIARTVEVKPPADVIPPAPPAVKKTVKAKAKVKNTPPARNPARPPDVIPPANAPSNGGTPEPEREPAMATA